MILITGNLVHSYEFIVRRLKNLPSKRSFTLMEMLVVLAVIVLLLGVSIPFFASFTKGAKLKAATKDIMAVLNTARSLAITKRENYSVNFDYANTPHSFYITAEGGAVHGKEYILPSSIRFYRSQEPENPTSFSSGKVTFSPRGGLTSATGSVWITDKKNNFRRITVFNTLEELK